MGIVYPKFPTVDRPHETVHVDEPLAEELLPGGSALCAYRPAIADHCIILTYQDRDRYADSELIVIPRDGIRHAIAVLRQTLARLEGSD